MLGKCNYRSSLRLLWTLVLCAGLLLPLPATAAESVPNQVLLPLAGRNACSGRQDATVPIGVQVYGNSGATSPLFSSLASSGATWLRVSIGWNAIEPSNVSPADYRWSSADLTVAASVQACMNIIATISDTADWAATEQTVPPYANNSPIKTANLADFAEFVGAMVERYDGDGVADAPSGAIVEYWELYNEPDYGPGVDGGGWGDYGARYAQMLQAVYPALKAANPNAKLVFGGIAYDGFVEDGGQFVHGFLENVLKAGGGDYFDVMNFHFYPAFRGRWATGSGTGLPEKTAAIRAILQTYGLQKPVVVTEAGWHNDVQDAYPSSDQTQSRYVAQFFTQAAALDLDFLIWWMLGDLGSTYRHRNGLVTDSTPPVRKPSFTVFQTVSARVGRSDYIGTMTATETGDADLEVHQFLDFANRDLYVAWLNPIDTDETVPLVLVGAKATVHSMSNSRVASLEDGDDGLADGKLTVNVGGDPVYIVVE